MPESPKADSLEEMPLNPSDHQTSSEGDAPDSEGPGAEIPASQVVLARAHETQEALIDFMEAIRAAKFPGHQSRAVSIGMHLIENMVAQGKAQIAAIQQQQVRDKAKK